MLKSCTLKKFRVSKFQTKSFPFMKIFKLCFKLSKARHFIKNISFNSSIHPKRLGSSRRKFSLSSRIAYRFLKLQSSRSSEAEQYFKRAIRLAPLDPSTHHHYGNLSFFSFFFISLFPSNTHTEWGKSEIFWFDGSLTLVFSFHYSWVSLINLEARGSMRESSESCRVVTEWLSISHCRCNSFADAWSEAWGGKMVPSGEQQPHDPF